MYLCNNERKYNMNNKLLLPSVCTALAGMAIAFFVTPKEANPGFISILTFIVMFLGTAAVLNMIYKRKRKKEESSSTG
jgi:Sec-independent protein secretion pathway component TatC